MDNNVLILKISYARGLVVEVGPFLLAIIGAAVAAYILYLLFRRKERVSWCAVEAEIPSLG